MKIKIFVAITFVILMLSLMALLVFQENEPSILVNEQIDIGQINGAYSAHNIAYNDISQKEIRILFAGDVMFARRIGEAINRGENPLENVRSKFEQYDYVVVNLECVVADQGVKQNKTYTFQAPEKSIEILKENGVDIVSLANNHVMDYGEQGLEDMIQNLQDADIGYFGAGLDKSEAFTPFRIYHYGTTIDLFGYNDRETYITNALDSSPGAAYFDQDYIDFDKSDSDIQIPFVHWGPEYLLTEDNRQSSLAAMMLDKGAEAIIGGHPHVIQPTRSIDDKYVVYSLGNFVFDQMPSITFDANMAEVIIQDKEVKEVNLIPITIDHRGFPVLK